MRTIPFSCFVILFFTGVSCTRQGKNEQKEKDVFQINIGTYYTNEWNRSDTVIFSKTKPKSIVRNWNLHTWEITNDSLFQEDSRGKSSFMGKTNAIYKLNSDTLEVQFDGTDHGGHQVNNRNPIIEKYLILCSNDTLLSLIRLDDNSPNGRSQKTNRISSTIRLR